MAEWSRENSYPTQFEMPHWVIAAIVGSLVVSLVCVVVGYFLIQCSMERHRRRIHVVEEPHGIELQEVVIAEHPDDYTILQGARCVQSSY